jgi:predicted membrane channel-forming protein YqfA (hemolysin III family)
MQKDLFERIASFLLGASWAIALFGALFTFKISLSFGLSFALFTTLLFILLSFVCMLLLDALIVHKEGLREAKKQTKLLEELLSQGK